MEQQLNEAKEAITRFCEHPHQCSANDRQNARQACLMLLATLNQPVDPPAEEDFPVATQPELTAETSVVKQHPASMMNTPFSLPLLLSNPAAMALATNAALVNSVQSPFGKKFRTRSCCLRADPFFFKSNVFDTV